jgi:hypothetical protein
MRGDRLAMLSLSAPLKDAHDNLLTSNAAAENRPGATDCGHVVCGATNEGFVRLKLAAALDERANLHGETDTMPHEPSRLLRHADGAGQFIGANAILAVRNLPDCYKPLVERQWAILENGADFGRKLFLGVLLFAFPHAAGRDKAHVNAATGRAMNSRRPAKLYHRIVRHFRISEVADSLHKSLGFGAHKAFLPQTFY